MSESISSSILRFSNRFCWSRTRNSSSEVPSPLLLSNARPSSLPDEVVPETDCETHHPPHGASRRWATSENRVHSRSAGLGDDRLCDMPLTVVSDLSDVSSVGEDDMELAACEFWQRWQIPFRRNCVFVATVTYFVDLRPILARRALMVMPHQRSFATAPIPRPHPVSRPTR